MGIELKTVDDPHVKKIITKVSCDMLTIRRGQTEITVSELRVFTNYTREEWTHTVMAKGSAAYELTHFVPAEAYNVWLAHQSIIEQIVSLYQSQHHSNPQ